MKKTTHRIGLILVSAALLGLTGTAFAAQGGPAQGAAREVPAGIEKLHDDYYAKTEATRQLLISKTHELDAQIYSPTPDEKKIQALTGEISALRAKLDEERVNLRRGMIREGAESGYGYGRRGWGHGDRGHGWGHGGRGRGGRGYCGGGGGYGPCAGGGYCGGGY